MSLVLAKAAPLNAQTAAAPNAPPQAVRTIDTLGLAAALPWAHTITADELRETAYILASDSLQGRETGTDGQRRAARFLSRRVAEIGLPPLPGTNTYEQPIALASAVWKKNELDIGDRDFEHIKGDYFAYPHENRDIDIESDEVLYLGYGIKSERYDDYAQAGNLRGRVAVVLAGEPFRQNGTSLVTGSSDTSEWSASDSRKRAAAQEAGLALLVIVEPTFQKTLLANMSKIVEKGLQTIALDGPDDLDSKESTTNVIHVSPKVFEALVAGRRRRVVRARKRLVATGTLKPVELKRELELKMEIDRRRLDGSNVLAYVRGSDPELADELVVVSAHYDHLGMRNATMFPGADDNASGSSTVLEIAEAFAEAAKAGLSPKRSVLMLFVSGEEKGLLGSRYYAEHPVFPLETTVANINIDMIGRYDEAHADSAAYIYVIGAGRISSDLDDATRHLNRFAEDIDLDYTFDAEDDPNRFYFRSDHYNFAKNGIPSVFFFSGVHEDYHRPGDTPDKLDYDKMVKVGRTAFVMAWNLANRPGALNREATVGSGTGASGGQ